MMNPGSGFGSGFGQQPSSSPFGTSPGFGSSGSASNTGFGASITLTGSASFGSGSQGFGSGTTASPAFGTGSVTLTGANNTGFNSSTFSTAGFGSAPGFDSTSTGTGNAGGFSRTSDSIFGTSGSRASAFGSSASSTQGFSTSVSSSGPSFGTGNPNAGFASTSSGSSMPAFGTSVPSGFAAQTTTSAKPTGAGTVFGSGFGSASSSTAGGSVFSAAGSVFGAVSSPAASGVSSASGTGFGGGGMRGFGTGSSGFGTTTKSTAPPLGSGSSGFGTASGTGLSGAGTGSAGFGTSSSGFGTGSAGFGTGSSGFSTGSAGFGTGSSGFGTGSSGFGTGSSGFGTGSSGFGTGTAGFGTGSSSLGTGSSGFGTGSSGFGTGTAGFGTGSSGLGTGSAGFGTGSSGVGTGSAGFGTGSSGVGTGSAGFGTGSSGVGTGSAGFGTGSSGVGTGSAGFGTGSSGAGTGSSGFGTASSGSGFGPGTSGGFGGRSSMFGTSSSAGPASTSFKLPSTQTQSTSVFGGPSAFGTQTTKESDGSSGPMSTATSTNSSMSSPTGFSALGSKTSSVFGQTSDKNQSGLGTVASSASTQSSSAAPTAFTSSAASSSVFGASTTSTGAPGVTAGFGLVTAPSSLATRPTTTSSVSTSSSFFGVGGGQAASVFGSSRMGATTSQSQTGLSTSQSASSPAGGSAPSFALPVSSSAQSSAFGASTTTFSSVFGGAAKHSQPEGSVFGRAGRTVVKQEPSETSRSSDSQATPFPVAAAGSGASVFGGSSSKLSSGQRFAPQAGSSNLFGGLRGDSTKPGTTQPSSTTASVFGGRIGPSVFGTRQSQESATNSKQTHGGRQTSETGQQPASSGQPQFPSAATVAAENQPKVKQEPGGKELFGGFPGDKPREGEGAIKSKVLGTGREGQGSKLLKSGRVLARGSGLEAGSSGSGSSSVFGGKREATLSSAAPAASSVFGGKREQGSTFSFPAAPPSGSSSGNQKRSAEGEGEGAREVKRGRSWKQQQDRSEQESEDRPSTSHTPEKLKLRRSSSVLEDISSKTTISCKGVPASLNKGLILRHHFSKFGKVKQVRPVPAKRAATIQFESHEAAAKAKKFGTKLPNHDKPLSIFWKTSTTEKSPSTGEEAARAERFSWKRSAKPDASAPSGQSSELQQYSLPSTVAAELASMRGADSSTCDPKFHAPDRSSSSARDRAARQGRSSRRTEPSRRARSRTPPASASASSTTSSSSAKPVKVDAATLSSLRNTVATTTMEKVNVLDLRDKLIRQKLGKQTLGGIDSKAFVGTCPDMCPEKERLYREEVRRLSLYEIIPGSSTSTGSTSLVDHTRAVKEYSRSSADQDEPLPHELRPLPVLTMTMNYLLTEIANRWEEERWGEWYDFLWNRTRSIRKEITQQQLCSLEVVELLEKCARFHVYCSERLCTEDSMVFDSKINDENLTKCLQTLKELYADMENKHGLFCPNEAEFRAYMVLMNLNEGDTLREVQQLRPDVRASPHISFAVKAYSALNSNNYVRFFRLVKTASFLNACILHRYFNQIRARALQIILRSHTSGQKKVAFSLSELVRLLVFESEEDVQGFCSYYGLRTEGSDLILDRSTYVEPESSIPMWRACGLVESKCMVSVGEVINGGRLEPPKLPPPQCSFDEQGRFIGHLEGLTDTGGAQERRKPFAVKASAKPPAPQPSALEQFETAAADTPTPAAAQHDAAVSQQQQQANFSNEMVKLIARELFLEVIDESVRIIARSGVEACRKVMSCDVDISDEIFASVTEDLSREVIVEVVDAERALQDQVAAAERREREERVATDLLQSLVDSTVDEQMSQIIQKEVEDARAREEADRLERCSCSLRSELLDEVTAEMALQVAGQVHQVEVVARLQLLWDLQRAVELKRLGLWLSVWRQALLVRQRQKRAMLDFPCAPPMQSASQRLREMFPDRPDNVLPLVPGKSHLLVNNRAHVTLLSPLEAEQCSLTLTAHLSLASLLNSLQRARAWQPLNLGSLLRAPLLQSLRRWPQRFLTEFAPLGVHWKLLLSLPGDLETEEQDEDSNDDMTGDLKHRDLLPVLKQWLCAKFTRGEGGDSTVDASQRNLLSLYSVELAAGASGPSSKLRLGVIVRNTPEFSQKDGDKQPTPEQVLSITKGTSAILFLLPHADTASDVPWLAARLRLARLLEAKPMLPPTPLVLLLPFGHSVGAPASPSALTSDVTGRLDIEKFQDQGLLSSVAVVELPVRAGQPPDVAVSSPILQAQVTEAVKFLASKVPEPPDLRRQSLGDLVEDVLTQHFFTPVLQDLKRRQQLGKLHPAPNAVIGLYNSVLDHLALALTSPALQDISWPAPELQHTAAKLDGVPMADWNSKSHLADIYGVVTNLRLPWFHYKDQSATEWGQACHDVWAFVSNIVKKRCNSAVSLTTRISHLLAQTCLQFENMCSLTLSEDHCTPAYVNAPWTDIILACVDFRLQRLHNWKEEEDLLGGDLQVFYEEEDLEEFEPPASWLQALLETEDLEIHRVEDTIKQATLLHFANTTCTGADTFSSRRLHRDGDKEGHAEDQKSGAGDKGGEPSYQSSGGSASNRTLLAAAQDFSKLPDNIRTTLDASLKLRLHVGEERQRAQDFERYLEKALREETAPEVDVSHILPASHTPRVLHTPALATTSSSGIWSEPRQEAAAASAGHDFGLTPQRPPLSSNLLPRKRLQQDAGTVSSLREVEEDSHKGVEADVAACGERQPLSQRLDRLKEDLRAQRYASEMFEKRLRNFLES